MARGEQGKIASSGLATRRSQSNQTPLLPPLSFQTISPVSLFHIGSRPLQVLRGPLPPDCLNRTPPKQQQQPNHSEILNSCIACATRFANKTEYEAHFHDVRKHYYCIRCDAHFESTICFHQHREHSDRHNMCTKCDLDFPTRKELVHHWITAEKSLHAYCEQCNAHFDTWAEEQNHYLQDLHHVASLSHIRPLARREVPCKDPGCGALFARPYEMNLHYLTAHREVLECPVPKCRMKFIDFGCRENHRKKCELERVACRHRSCTAGFKEKEEMEKHWEERHTTRSTTPEQQRGLSRSPSPTERIRFTCPIVECRREFGDIQSQIKHIVSRHAYCPACSTETGGKVFRNHEELEDHLREGLPRHSYCRVCRMMFDDVGALETHFGERHGEKDSTLIPEKT